MESNKEISGNFISYFLFMIYYLWFMIYDLWFISNKFQVV